MNDTRCRIIAVASQKGGVGKSFTAQGLAVQSLLDGRRSAIVDADPQGTSSKWARRREASAPTVEAVSADGIEAAIASLRDRGAQLIVIDTPPHARPITALAVAQSDLVVIPTEPFVESLEAIADTIAIVRNAGKASVIFLNKVPTSSTVARMVRTPLASYGVPVCAFDVMQRIGHSHASMRGMTVAEAEPDGKAAEELRRLWSWISKQMEGA